MAHDTEQPGSVLTRERLQEIYHYDPETGVWTHRKPRQCVRAGSIAGSKPDHKGYWRLSVDSRGYLAHRLAWLYMTGEWPPEQVDHVDGDRSNNQWSNLRLASNGQNKANSRIARNNTTGFKGVYRTTRGRPWRARIAVEGRRIGLGSFDTAEDAHLAYRAAAQRYFGEYARAV